MIAADLAGTGLFREIPASAHISSVTSFDAPVAYADWKAINAQALVTGAVVGRAATSLRSSSGCSTCSPTQPLGDGLQFTGTTAGWRRMAHKVADVVYSRITGEGGYFDSRVVFVSEQGPKNARLKRLAIMDYDGANVQYLTDGSVAGAGAAVLADRRPGALHLLRDRLAADLPARRSASMRRTALSAAGGQHVSFAAAVLARRRLGGVLARTGRQHRHLPDGAAGRHPAPADRRALDRDRAELVQPRRQPDRVRKRPLRHAADLRDAGGGRRGRRGSASARAATARRSGARAATTSPSPSRTPAGSTSA